MSIGGRGCCIQVLGSRDSAFRAGLCWMLPNMVMVVEVVVTEGTGSSLVTAQL